jgi:hypothetical protein
MLLVMIWAVVMEVLHVAQEAERVEVTEVVVMTDTWTSCTHLLLLQLLVVLHTRATAA